MRTGMGGLLNEEDRGDLPSEYQRVEYLKSNGSPYIETHYIPNSLKTKIECNVLFEENKIAETGIAIFQIDHGSTGHGYGLTTWNNKYYIDLNVGFKNYSIDATQILNFVFQDNLCYVDGSLSVFGKEFLFDSYDTLAIFGWRRNGRVINEHICSARIYSFSIYDNNVLVHDYIPCYRISDNKPGMYDIKEKAFLINYGQGEDFIVGPDVTSLTYSGGGENDLIWYYPCCYLQEMEVTA